MTRIVFLTALLVALVAMTIEILAPFPLPIVGNVWPFFSFSLWVVMFGLYFLACLVLVVTKPARGRWRWLELGLILGGALLLRALLLPLPPFGFLSPDAWRYVWDARVTLLGYSPYALPPDSPQFVGLHDFLFNNLGYQHVPTIYPPAAQAVYILSYLLAPSNLYFLKGIFVGCELLSCGLIMQLLRRRGLDPARVLLYAWCPLPIIEVALQGHLDALLVVFSLLAALVALNTSASTGRGGRVWTGFWLAASTLTKLYPLIYIVAVWRRRERLLPLVLFLVSVLGYLPYVILGHGQVLGFFSTYMSQQMVNGGLLRIALNWLNDLSGISQQGRAMETNVVLGGMLVAGILMVWLLRQKQRISVEAALLVLTEMVFFVSPRVYPWYTIVLLPWVAILIRPVWTRRGGLNPEGIVVAVCWCLSCLSIMGYSFSSIKWDVYYRVVYGPTVLALLLAGGVMLARSGWLRLRLPVLIRARTEEEERMPEEIVVEKEKSETEAELVN